MPDRTTLHGRPATPDGPVHIREVIAELLVRRGIDRQRQPDRMAAPPAFYSDRQALVAATAAAACR